MWMKVMSPDFMSSEYSCSDTDDDSKLVTQKLEWRSKKVSGFFEAIDNYYEDNKSPMAKRQSKKRFVSTSFSTRGVPANCQLQWAIRSSFLPENQDN